jgi:hypothetical protein
MATATSSALASFRKERSEGTSDPALAFMPLIEALASVVPSIDRVLSAGG